MTDWLEKCKTCRHCYTKKSEGDDTYYCRCKNGKCNYEVVKIKKKNKKKGDINNG